MDPSRPSSSSCCSTSATITRFSGAKPSLASTEAPASSESCLLSCQPFIKKYAWAVVGALIAISGSAVLLACSSSAHSSSRQARRCSSSAGPARGLAAQELVHRSRAFHSQGTNTEAEAETVTNAETGKGALIVDADVCSAVPEVIIRDTCSSPSVHALIDADTIDRSAPLTIYSSLACTVSDTIRRPVSWSEPYIVNKEELLEPFTSYSTHAIEEPLKPHPHIPLTPPTQRKNIPILGPSLTKPHNTTTLDPSSSTSRCYVPPRPSLFPPKLKETLDSYPCFGLTWGQVRIDLFLLLSVFGLLFFYFVLKRDIHPKQIEIQQVKPFPVFRMFP